MDQKQTQTFAREDTVKEDGRNLYYYRFPTTAAKNVANDATKVDDEKSDVRVPQEGVTNV